MQMMRKRWPLGTALAALITLFAACAFLLLSPASAPAQQPAKGDIVSIGGAVTEILYALDLGDRVAAVDTTSLYPRTVLKEKPNVGYMRALSAEGVLSVPAKLILAAEGAGPPEAIAALKASSTKFVTIPGLPSADGIVEKINAVAQATGKVQEGQALAASVKSAFQQLNAKRQTIKKPLRTLFVLSVSSGRIMVGGKGTSADGILTLAGAMNAAEKVNGFKPVSAEAIVAMAPDAIIVMKRRGTHGAERLQEMPAIKVLPAAKNKRIRAMDGLYLLGFGPRTPDAAQDVMNWLYPELKQKG